MAGGGALWHATGTSLSTVKLIVEGSWALLFNNNSRELNHQPFGLQMNWEAQMKMPLLP